MVEKVIVHDKRFKLYLSEDRIQEQVKRVAAEMSRDLRDKDVVLCPVLTGSYMFFADLTRYLDFDPDIAFVRYSSYSGTQSTGQVKAILGFPEKCRGRHVVIVEDIVDSGISMEYMIQELSKLEPASISICTFFFKPGNFQKSFPINYIGMEIPNDFIVGYGLDYDGKGRTFKDIYTIDE